MGDGIGGGQLVYIRVWVSSYSFYFFLVLLQFVLSHSQVPLFRWLNHDGCCVFLCFLCLCSTYLGVTSAQKLLCLLCKTILEVRYLIIILWIFLEKGECFDFNHSLGSVHTTLYIIRLLGQVYHFSLLNCYPCSSSAQSYSQDENFVNTTKNC